MVKAEDQGQSAAGLRTLERGLDILDLFGQGALKLSLSEIAEKINLTPSTTSRLLHTLNLRGYVSRDEETKKFSIGPQALRFSVSSFRTFDLRKIAAPFLQSLHRKYNESVSLYILLDGLFAGLIALIGYAFSFYITNQFAAAAFPLLLFWGIDYLSGLLARAIPGAKWSYEISPIAYLHPATLRYDPNAAIILIEAVMLFCSAIAIIFKRGVWHE